MLFVKDYVAFTLLEKLPQPVSEVDNEILFLDIHRIDQAVRMKLSGGGSLRPDLRYHTKCLGLAYLVEIGLGYLLVGAG